MPAHCRSKPRAPRAAARSHSPMVIAPHWWSAAATPHNLINGFLPGDVIDLQGIGTATSATLGANNVLTISGGASTVTLNLDPAQNFTGESFNVASDGSGGTDITATTVGNDHPPHI